ncbi:MAG: polysaccharide biosynthesis protein [Actinomycetes bacterium]
MAGVSAAIVPARLRSKRSLRIITDCTAWFVAIYGAVLLRLDFDVSRIETFRVAALIPLAWALQFCFGWIFGLYRGFWINGSFDEVIGLVRSVGAVTAVLFVFDVFVPGARPAPASAVVAAGLFALVISAGIRYVARRVIDRRRSATGAHLPRAIIFGVGECGVRMLQTLLFETNSPYRPVALLDDDPEKRNLTVKGLRVSGGRNAMGDVARQHDASVLLIAIPTADGATIRELTDLAELADLEVLVVPPVDELFGGTVRLGDLREPTEADLLGRRVIETDLEAAASYLQDRVVLVTGAGGSIGSELCRQIARFGPRRLVMVDRDESGLHQVQLSIEGRALLDTPDLVLLDIRDRRRVTELFGEIRPDVVFHAAALKHLPLLQAHPVEALKSNVWGTLSVLDASAAAGVTRFVNISTDKAANACSILGYSKRVAEGLTSFFGLRHPGTYLSVRFGNVLGSRGSVLTAFRAQIEAGGPVTVTHPDVTRFFMTIEEAVQLVIQAGAIGHDGEALVLDMGEPVKIADVARRLAANHSPEIPIVFTGLRPGEKLHEELFADGEESHQADHELIRYVRVPDLDPTLVRDVDPTVSGADMSSLLEFLARTMTIALGDEKLPTGFEGAPVTPEPVVADGAA